MLEELLMETQGIRRKQQQLVFDNRPMLPMCMKSSEIAANALCGGSGGASLQLYQPAPGWGVQAPTGVEQTMRAAEDLRKMSESYGIDMNLCGSTNPIKIADASLNPLETPSRIGALLPGYEKDTLWGKKPIQEDPLHIYPLPSGAQLHVHDTNRGMMGSIKYGRAEEQNLVPVGRSTCIDPIYGGIRTELDGSQTLFAERMAQNLGYPHIEKSTTPKYGIKSPEEILEFDERMRAKWRKEAEEIKKFGGY